MASIVLLFMGSSDATERKPEAVAFAEEVRGCLLAGDEGCLSAISTLDEEKVAQSAKLGAMVHRVLGERRSERVLAESWTWRKAVGSNPGLHMRFSVLANYDGGEVTETYMLVHRDGRFLFAGVNFASDALMDGLAGEREDPKRCRERVEQLRAGVAAAAAHSSRTYFDAAALKAAVHLGGVEINEPAPVLKLIDGQVSLDGRSMGDWGAGIRQDAVVADMQTLERNHSILHPGSERATLPVFVLAEPEAPAQPLLRLLEALPKIYAPLLLVQQPGFTPVDPVPQGATAAVRKRVEAARSIEYGAERSAAIAQLIVDGMGGCRQVRSLFSKVATADLSRKGELVVDGLPRAILECGCRSVDLDLLQAATAAMFDSDAPPMRGLPVPRGGERPDAMGRVRTVGGMVKVLARVGGG